MGDAAVSEVVGSILIFGIVSMLFTLSLLGFVAAKEAAQERVVELQAESVAQRIAGVIVGAAIFYDAHNGTGPDMDFRRHVQIEGQIEQSDFQIDLDNDTVVVTVPAFDRSATVSVLGANKTALVTVCDMAPFTHSAVLHVRVSDPPTPCYYQGTTTQVTEPKAIYLEVAS